MANIKAYSFTPRAVHVCEEVWDSTKKKVTPIKSLEMVDMHMVLDSITLAVEAGVVDTLTWPQQLFAKKAVFLEFIEQLAQYDDCYRITDQWWQALAALVNVSDEEGFISTEEIAGELLKSAAQDGLLENWGKKKPAYKYTKEQYEEALFQSIKNSHSLGKLGMSREQIEAMYEVTSFGGTHYGADVLSDARYRQAEAEGRTLLKKVVAKKSPAAKKKAK